MWSRPTCSSTRAPRSGPAPTAAIPPASTRDATACCRRPCRRRRRFHRRPVDLVDSGVEPGAHPPTRAARSDDRDSHRARLPRAAAPRRPESLTGSRRVATWSSSHRPGPRRSRGDLLGALGIAGMGVGMGVGVQLAGQVEAGAPDGLAPASSSTPRIAVPGRHRQGERGHDRAVPGSGVNCPAVATPLQRSTSAAKSRRSIGAERS